MELLLQSLGLEALLPVFIENDIDEETIKIIGETELRELIPKIGPRLKLKKYIDSLKHQEVLNEDIPCSQTTKSSSSVSVVFPDSPVTAARKTTRYTSSFSILTPEDDTPVTAETNLTSHEKEVCLTQTQTSEDSNTCQSWCRSIVSTGA
ncbi:hypothetical protein O0L34_g19074 [Tuta absoluta]|nr:hypothetical protein O0L34_g19074 [Tuta absoluta]